MQGQPGSQRQKSDRHLAKTEAHNANAFEANAQRQRSNQEGDRSEYVNQGPNQADLCLVESEFVVEEDDRRAPGKGAENGMDAVAENEDRQATNALRVVHFFGG